MLRTAVSALVTLISVQTASAADFGSFPAETTAIGEAIHCRSGGVTRTDGLPDLWGCIAPGAEVVKVFVNATEDNEAVENVKIMWNDWTRDTGYGLHTDSALAVQWVEILADRYAPGKADEILQAFAGESEVVVEGPEATLRYSYSRGPAIDERLITVTPAR